MNTPIAITVYCSSKIEVDPAYHRAASDLGHAIANERWQLVYGGNRIGMMGTLSDAVREAGGSVVGITPQVFVDHGYGDPLCADLIVVKDIRQRKALLEHHGSALVALPGGLGTLEEILEVIAGAVLHLHHKPVVILNIASFYDPLLEMIQKCIDQHFVSTRAHDCFHIADSVDEAMAYLRSKLRPLDAEQLSETPP